LDSRKTVFLTGATGNMGREAVKRIAAERGRLRLKVLVRPEERAHPVVREIGRRKLAEIVWGDLTDAASIREGIKGADIVLHVGGLVSPLADRLPKEVVTAVNVGGARNIVDAIHAVADPRTTLAITWCICAPLLLLWAYRTLKARPTGPAIWLGLAAAAPLTVLPTYHFQHDAKLLLIAIPACAILWSKAGRPAKLALLFTLGAILINGDIFSAIRILLTRSIIVPHAGFISHLTTLVLTRPSPLVLLAMAVFYLLHFRRDATPSSLQPQIGGD